jgi:PTS system nitrogen regulatory IIA component
MRLTVREAAGLLNVSEKTIYRWIQQNKLPAYKVNEQYRFNRAELLEWATARKVNVSVEIFHEREDGGAAPAGLGESLRAGGVYYRIGGSDKASVLRQIVEIMPLGDDVDREFLLQVMLARESLGSTGIGDGIAIPHVRNPIVMHIPRPMATLAFLESPIDFGSLDGKPVNTLFTIVSPTVRAHLHLLSRLGFALRQPAFAACIAGQASREDIFAQAQAVDAAIDSPVPAGEGGGI